MPIDFTMIVSTKQHFGNDPAAFDDVEPGVPFVGPSKGFTFDCPGIQAGETALLTCQLRDVDHAGNLVQVNGIDVSGGLPPSPARDQRTSHTILIEPRHQLQTTGNVLHIASRSAEGESGGDIDDFIVDGVVILYKTAEVVWALPSATGDLAGFLKTELLPSITNVRGSGATANPADQHNEYVLPTASQLAVWRGVFRSLLAGAWGKAHIQAHTLSSTYNVVRFLDTASARTYFILMEGVPGEIPRRAAHDTSVTIDDPSDATRRGWGTYVFDPVATRALSLSAPHPHDDLDTAEEAVDAYVTLGAHTLLIAGADRDQNTALATCDQSSRPYLEADVSHTSESVFQIAFEEIYSNDAVTWHLQFHGNSVCEADVFLSNGVVSPPALLSTLAANIEAKSAEAAGGPDVLTADVFDDAGDCSARGTDNMQMRFASGRAHGDICPSGHVPLAPSRFIHVEQQRDARREKTSGTPPGRNRAVVIEGILATFP